MEFSIFIFFAGLALVIPISQCSLFDENTAFHIDWSGKTKNLAHNTLGDDNIHIATNLNEKYVCYLPKLQEEESEAMDMRGSLLPPPSEIDLLRPLFDKDICISKMTSYWTYELCHGKSLRQFHKEEGVVKVSGSASVTIESSNTASFNLGNYPEPDWRNQRLLKERFKTSETPLLYRFSRLELAYFPVELEPGDICDLTNEPRHVRVLYFCQPDTKAEFYDIQEVATCSYDVLIFTSYLCDNKRYRWTASSKEIGIKCYTTDDKSPVKPVELSKLLPSPPRYKDIFGKKKTAPASKQAEQSAEERGDGDGDDDDDDDQYVDDFWIMDQMGLGPAPDLDAEDPFSKHGFKASVANARKKLGGERRYLVKPPSPKSPPKPMVTDYQQVKDFLRGLYCLHGGVPGGWWKYELCFGKSIQQYHDEPSKDKRLKRTEVFLGHWQADKHLEWLKLNPTKRPKQPAAERKSVTYFYGDGDICDVTGGARHTQVRLTCNPTDKSERIGVALSEPSTCVYQIDVIAGQWLCTVVQAAGDDGIFDPESVIALLSTNERETTPIPPITEKNSDGEERVVTSPVQKKTAPTAEVKEPEQPPASSSLPAQPENGEPQTSADVLSESQEKQPIGTEAPLPSETELDSESDLEAHQSPNREINDEPVVPSPPPVKSKEEKPLLKVDDSSPSQQEKEEQSTTPAPVSPQQPTQTENPRPPGPGVAPTHRQ